MSTLHIARRSDFVTGLVVAAVGVVYFINTFFVQTTDDVVDPATFPRIVGIGLIVLGGLLSIAAVRPGRPTMAEATASWAPAAAIEVPDATESSYTAEVPGTGTAPVAEAGADSPATGTSATGTSADATSATGTSADATSAAGSARRPKLQVLLYFAVFFAYLFILIPVGFLLSTAVFLLTVTTLYTRGKWLRNAVFAVVFSAVVYFAFKYGLGVFLPPGILG